ASTTITPIHQLTRTTKGSQRPTSRLGGARSGYTGTSRATAMRLLLVEDDRALASALCKGLATSGFAVDLARTAAEARQLAGRNPYHLALLDLGLPDADGLTLLAKLRELSPHLPVLILTARGTVTERVSGLDAGADDYVAKPFALPELEARIRAL